MLIVRRIAANQIRRRTSSAFFANRRSYSSDYVKSLYDDVDIPNVHFTEFIFEHYRKFSDRVALQCGITGRKYTYDDVLVASTRFSKALRMKLKLQKGDVIALILPNIPEFYTCTFGCMLAGMKVTTINPVYTTDEIKRQLLDADVRGIITLIPLFKTAKTSVDLANMNIPIITVKDLPSESTPAGAIDFQELVDAKVDIPDFELPPPDETVFIPYSSGTTGLPKGVELTSGNLVANITQVTVPDFKLVLPETIPQDITLAILPMFHVYAFTTSLALMKDGAKVVTMPKFTPDTYINGLKNHNPTLLMLVPPMVMFLYTHPGVKTEYLSSVRTVTSGAAPLGALDEEKLRQKVAKPLNILQGYGLSETSPAVVMIPLRLQGKFPGSMGTTIPNTLLKIVDPDGKEGKHLGYNQTGELWVKGPQVMKGYLNRPEETEKSFHDGWFKTGDLVRCDEHGMVYIADRMKELIKVKGLQVPPAELEEIIRDFPGVAEAAVIGIPHEYHGEVPRAYIIAKPNDTIDVKKLEEHVSSKVAKHKRLAGGISIVGNIPKTASGKILRKALREQYESSGI